MCAMHLTATSTYNYYALSRLTFSLAIYFSRLLNYQQNYQNTIANPKISEMSTKKKNTI